MRKARMSQAIEASDLAVWDYNVETGHVHLSDSWSWFLGGRRTPTDTTIKTLTQLVPLEDRDMVRNAIIKAIKGEDNSEYKVSHRVARQNGQLIWVHSQGRVTQRAPDGRALRMVGVTRDISDSKRLESELVLHEARYRAVIQAAVDGFWIVNMQGRLLEVNDVYVHQSGYSREELLQMRISDLDAKESTAEVAEHQHKVRRTQHDRFESEHRRKDGSIWPVEIVVTYWPGLDLSFVFIMDTTERKRTERQVIEQRRELEALHVSQVAVHTAAAFAHEINQPLGAICAYSEAAIMMAASGSPDLNKLREAIAKGRDQTLRAGNSIRQLLKMLESGSTTHEALDLNKEIRVALKYAAKDTEPRLRTELRLEQEFPPVRANRMHLQKVLLNLLRNGVDAMRDAGTPDPLVIVDVHARRSDGLAQVTVRDKGPGIRNADAARLFEPFYTTKKKGIGMGLAISRSLIEAGGGQLWYDPGHEPGCTFHLTLPFAS